MVHPAVCLLLWTTSGVGFLLLTCHSLLPTIVSHLELHSYLPWQEVHFEERSQCHSASSRRHGHQAASRAVCHLFLRRKQGEEEKIEEAYSSSNSWVLRASSLLRHPSAQTGMQGCVLG